MALTIFLHITIKIYSRYLDYKHNCSLNEQPPDLATRLSVKPKHSVSLSSALFFTLVLIGGPIAKLGGRNLNLYFVIPLNLTTMCVFFPMLVIFLNKNLKHLFSQSFQPIFKFPRKYLRRKNRVTSCNIDI